MKKNNIGNSKPIVASIVLWTVVTSLISLSHGLSDFSSSAQLLIVGIAYVSVVFFTIFVLSGVFTLDGINLRFGILDLLLIFFIFYFFVLAVCHYKTYQLSHLSIYVFLIGKTLYPIVLIAITTISTAVFGYSVLEYFDSGWKYSVESIVVSIGLGYIVLSYAIFLIGFFGMIYVPTCLALVFTLFLIGRKHIRPLVHELSKKRWDIKTHFLTDKKMFYSFVFLSCFLLFLLTLLSSSSGLLSAGWDTFHTYLVFAKTYAENHAFVEFPFHPHWGFPQFTEMIFTYFYTLGDARGVFYFNWFTGVLLAAAIWSLSRKLLGGAYQQLALATVLAMPIFYVFSGGYIKVDLLFSFYYILACSLFISYLDSKKSWKLALVALFVGVFLSIKYTGYLLGVAFFIPMIVLIIKKRFGQLFSSFVRESFLSQWHHGY